jgi:H+/Cl- antiporter ClcA
LVVVGVCVTLLVAVLGRPADVELLVDNIHVPGGTSASSARLRSLLPISLLCIGAGGTLGPEAPVVTTTGSVAHRLAQWAQLDHDDMRVVTMAGMAAGFAVLFGAPFGAALFALEIPHRRGLEYHEAVIPAAIGASIGFAISVMVGGHGLEPIWSLPSVTELALVDLGYGVVAGVVGATIAVVFTKLTRVLTFLVHYLGPAWRPATGGLLLGLLAIVTPYALTNGEWQVASLTGAVTVGALVIAAMGKLVGAAVAVACGWRGGFIIPLFFVGFCVGRAIADQLPGATEWAFVLSVMAAANVGVTKTPLGSTLVVTEMSGMTVLPATLLASLTALVLTSPLGVIGAQRRRVDAYGARHGTT